jgi:cytochrome c oxidase assembly protein subunit 11
MSEDIKKKNAKLAIILALVASSMFGFAYVMADSFAWFCELVGIKRVPVEVSRNIDVQFLTLVNNAPINFWVEKTQLNVHPNEYHRVNFYAENKTDKTIITRAVPSFVPAITAQFFEKTECFCFTEQEIKPHEVKTMPMRFRVKAELPTEYQTITLAYTFFDITDKSVK